ncbi:hypothetical protein V2E24_01105 [Mycoplasmopsis ciconiae]|uniref:Transmembrane protein n=1 Tax=Mycoplasmopsis ciconiae TaxID=561067 RepID=A0ABU7ML61_9BACT|nr:hypothetical protein [Mycoplasmopsis ciconiae]
MTNSHASVKTKKNNSSFLSEFKFEVKKYFVFNVKNILLWINYLFIFALSAAYLFLVPRFFNEKGISFNTLFDFSSYQNQGYNFVSLYSYFFMFLIMLITLTKNANNIKKNFFNSLYYLPWYVLYLSLSIATLVILDYGSDSDLMLLFYKNLIIIPLLLLNFSFEWFLTIKKYKASPINSKEQNFYYVSIFFRFVIIALYLTLFYLFISGNNNKILSVDTLFVENQFINFWKANLLTNHFVNVIYLTLAISAMVFVVILSRINWVLTTNKKEKIKNFFSTQTYVLLSVFVAALIWFAYNLITLDFNDFIIIKPKLDFYPFVFYLLLNIIIVSIVTFLSYSSKLKSFSVNIISFINLLAILVIFSLSIILRSFDIDRLNDTVIVFINALAILLLFINSIIKTKNKNLFTYIIYTILFISIYFILIFQIFEVYLLNHNNNQLSSIPSPYKIVDFWIIWSILVLFVYLFAQAAIWSYSGYVIYKHNKKNRKLGVKNV